VNHVRTFARATGAELAVVCDRDEMALARALRMAPAARGARKLTDALAADDVDAVVLATSAGRHADEARAALRAGKHVLVEAPLATRSADAEGVIAAARAAGRTLMVGHSMLYHPAFEALDARVRAGELGQLRYLAAVRAGQGSDVGATAPLWSLAPQDVSMALRLVDASPDSVSARGSCFGADGVEDVVFMTTRFAGGVLAHLQVSRVEPLEQRRLVAVGSTTAAELADVAEEDLLLRQTRHFLDCIGGGATPRSDGAHGIAVVRVLEAAQESLACDGTPVAV